MVRRVLVIHVHVFLIYTHPIASVLPCGGTGFPAGEAVCVESSGWAELLAPFAPLEGKKSFLRCRMGDLLPCRRAACANDSPSIGTEKCALGAYLSSSDTIITGCVSSFWISSSMAQKSFTSFSLVLLSYSLSMEAWGRECR